MYYIPVGGINIVLRLSYNPKHGILNSKTWHLGSPKVNF